MKYLCLIYDEEKKMGAMSKSEADAFMGEYFAFTEGIPRAGTTWAAKRCSRCRPRRPCASRNGKMSTTDGPFAETKEQLGGYYLIEARDLNDAIQVAAKIPSAAARQRRSAADRGVQQAAAGLTHIDCMEGDARDQIAASGRRRLPLRVAPRPRDADPPARRLRSRRGGAARCVHRGRRAVAARRRARQSAGLARLDGALQGDRRHAPARAVRRLARRAGGTHRSGGGAASRRVGRGRGRRRSAAADLHVLPSGAAARRAGRADAARGLRPDDRRDRARLS